MGLFSQSFHYYNIAVKSFENYSEPNDAIVTIIFSTMFIEAILNDTIARENLTHELHMKNNFKLDEIENYKYDFDIYFDKISFYQKIKVLFEKNGKNENYTNDIEFIELKHLVSIRNSITHLKPIVKEQKGFPKAALNYLKNKKKIINPFGEGVHWIDQISNKEMAEWSLKVVKQSIEYFYNSTFKPPFGISQLDFYCLKLSIGKYK